MSTENKRWCDANPENIALKSVCKDDDSDGEGSDVTTVTETEQAERGVWKNNVEFFLAIMGYTVGVGSVWRFPIILRQL